MYSRLAGRWWAETDDAGGEEFESEFEPCSGIWRAWQRTKSGGDGVHELGSARWGGWTRGTFNTIYPRRDGAAPRSGVTDLGIETLANSTSPATHTSIVSPIHLHYFHRPVTPSRFT